MSKFYQQDYVTAQEFFLRYTSNFHGSNYIKSANHKLFLISLLTDSTDNISKYRNLVLEKGNALIDEDMQAMRDIQNNKKINIELLNSRILFDGDGCTLTREIILAIICCSNCIVVTRDVAMSA